MKNQISFQNHQTNRSFTERIKIIIIGLLTFFISPMLSWLGLLSSCESAVFSSLSRMIWYSGNAFAIFGSMFLLFVTMFISFMNALKMSGLSQTKAATCKIILIVSYLILYVGVMEIRPGDGITLTAENIWHGILSFGGIFIIFFNNCLYAFWNRKKDHMGMTLLLGFLVFTIVTTAFAIFNVYDENSYVLVSAVTELYALTMLNLNTYFSYFLAFVFLQSHQ